LKDGQETSQNSPFWLLDADRSLKFSQKEKNERSAEDSFDLGFDLWKTLFGARNCGGKFLADSSTTTVENL
jgi:hypothetical protein